MNLALKVLVYRFFHSQYIKSFVSFHVVIGSSNILFSLLGNVKWFLPQLLLALVNVMSKDGLIYSEFDSVNVLERNDIC